MGDGATYEVRRAVVRPPQGCGWDEGPWRGVKPLSVALWMGAEPSHKPTVEAKLLWDDDALHAAFRVRDRWVRSVVTAPQGPVCTDSCVEFFFTPGTDLREGYFNVEVNCGGTALFMHQMARGVASAAMTAADIAALDVRHTMPAVVDPEVAEPVEWLVSYRVPYRVLRRHAPVAIPVEGARWRANLYKCADASSHPHWLTWAAVGRPEPDFHRPEFFGTLAFEG
jgi:hypothetical protein